MPQATYTPLATITLSSNQSTVTFSNLPSSGYRDLVLVAECLSNTTSGSETTEITINSDNGANYSWVSAVWQSGGTPASYSGSGKNFARVNTQASSNTNRSIIIANFLDYSATDKHKSCVLRWSGIAESQNPGMGATRWASTTAISSIRLSLAVGTAFVSGSTFSLYGIAG